MILGGKLVVGIEKTKVYTLDEILGSGALDGYNNILLKIDTEGFESRVLQGAKKIIQGNQIHLIQVESMNHVLFSKNPLNSSNKILESLGFKLKKKFLFPALNFFDVVYERK
jgi:ADP-dependent phosphofructokinase/glucokinase